MRLNERVKQLLMELLLKGYIVGFDEEVVSGRVNVYVRRLEDVKLYNLREEIEGVKINYVEVGEVSLLTPS